MKKSKRWLTLVVALCLTISLAGCGSEVRITEPIRVKVTIEGDGVDMVIEDVDLQLIKDAIFE